MNVMAQAHKMTKEFFKKVPSSKMSYAGIFKENLVLAHNEYKAECEASPVEWYSVEGHVIDEETGKQVPVGFGSFHASCAAADILFYVKNFKKHSLRLVATRENGSVRVEKPKTNYK